MKRFRYLLVLSFIFGIIQYANAQKSIEDRLSNLEKGQIRLEEGQKALNQRIDDLNQRVEEGQKALNQRIDDLNQRVEDLRGYIDKRFSDLNMWLQFIFGAMVCVIAGLVTQWIFMWRKISQLDTVLAMHLKESGKDVYVVKLEELGERVEKLEKVVLATR